MNAHIRPAVFGAFDGLTVVIGVLLSSLGHPELVFKVALGVALAEGIGMFFGEWLSESDNGLSASAVIGGATVTASVLPALPYLWLAGLPALAASGIAVAALAGVITVLRAPARGWLRATLETYGVLAVTVVAVILIGLTTPGGVG